MKIEEVQMGKKQELANIASESYGGLFVCGSAINSVHNGEEFFVSRLKCIIWLHPEVALSIKIK